AHLIVGDVAEFTRDAHAKLSHPDFARQILVEEPEKFYKPRLIKAGVWCFCRTGAAHERRRHLEAAAQADTARVSSCAARDVWSGDGRPCAPHDRFAREWSRGRDSRGDAQIDAGDRGSDAVRR